VLSIGKWQILIPQGAKTPEPILMKLDMVDYVPHPKGKLW